MLCIAIKDAAHLHGHALILDIAAEYLRAVRLGKDRLRNLLTYLPAIDVPSRHQPNIRWTIAAQIPVHQPQMIVAFNSIVRKPLNQRTSAIANADNGDVDRPPCEAVR